VDVSLSKEVRHEMELGHSEPIQQFYGGKKREEISKRATDVALATTALNIVNVSRPPCAKTSGQGIEVHDNER
jgi:hypothetical protein